MTKNLPITAIELEGFQCFEKPTRIEFAPITLLYGPNSAGKSAIFDALELVQQFWNPADQNENTLNTLINRWARRSKTSAENGGRFLRIAIELPYSEPDNIYLHTVNLESDYQFGVPFEFNFFTNQVGDEVDLDVMDTVTAELENRTWNKCVRMEFEINTLDDELGQLKHVMLDKCSIKFDGLLVVEAISGRNLCDWYRPDEHYEGAGRTTLVRLYDYKIFGDPFRFEVFRKRAVSKGSELAASIDYQRIYRSQADLESAMATEPYLIVPYEPENPWELQADSAELEELGSDWEPNTADYFEVDIDGSPHYSIYTMKLLANACSPFRFTEMFNQSSSESRHINRLMGFCGQLIVEHLINKSPPMVSGDRRLPRSDEFTQQVNLADPPRSKSSSTAMQYFCELLLRASHATHLIKEIPAQAEDRPTSPWSNILQFGFYGEGTPEHLKYKKLDRRHRVEAEAKLLDDVNHVLSSHLFQTKMYQLKGKSELILQFESSTLAPDTEKALEAGLKANVSMVLVDPIQNELTLDDVGSGIGYFLPCMVAFFQPGVVRVQQPELHLHPALQANIGDTLIESLGVDGSQVICETHSEHMLLRILKRIRQQSNVVSANDVVAYYFDPSGSDELDGLGNETILTKQEISPFGDFVHRWPKGFFEERWQELSDD